MKRIIPFGDHCATSIILKQLEVRDYSYPFDWIMTEDPDKNAFEWYIQLLKMLLDGVPVEEITREFLLGTDFPEKQGNSMGYQFAHETGDNREIFDKYVRRFSRLKDHLRNDECTIILCTRFTSLISTITDLRKLLSEYNISRISFIVITGVNEMIDGVQQISIPYNRIDFYNYDYSSFRPRMCEELRSIFEKKLLKLYISEL